MKIQLYQKFIAVFIGLILSCSTALASGPTLCAKILPFPGSEATLIQDFEVPLLTEKVLTFPTLKGNENYITYNRSVNVPYQKDQCGSACSYNSVASYIETLDSYARTGRANSATGLEVSANYLMAEKLLDQFSMSLERRKRTPTIAGGWIFQNLLRALREGVPLEKNYRSLTRVNTPLLIQKLNAKLQMLNEQFPTLLLPREVVHEATVYAQQLLANAFGRTNQSNPELYSLKHLKGDISFYDFEHNSLTSQEPNAPVALKEVFDHSTLHRLVEFEIRKTIDQGLPVLFGYIHIDNHLNKETGLISMTGSTESVGPGHAALIVGYKLDIFGRITMLKIQNSHANAPILHMDMDYFRASTNTLLILRLPEKN